MPRLSYVFAAVIATILSLPAAAQVVLTPANPQPTGLTPGLKVVYGTAPDIKSLDKASWATRKHGKPGQPLRGLSYADTKPGEGALTSGIAEKVAAQINGYIRFDAPGTYDVDFVTNDGIRATIGGQQVGYFDGRQTCQPTFTETVQVPQAGWYEVDILWFQRLVTSCLNMRWGPAGGQVKWVPDAQFGYK